MLSETSICQKLLYKIKYLSIRIQLNMMDVFEYDE